MEAFVLSFSIIFLAEMGGMGRRRAGERPASRSGRWAVLTIGTAFFLAELGDKTMLATVTLATTEEPWATWLGSTAGMVAADAIAVAIGAAIGTRLPERATRPF